MKKKIFVNALSIVLAFLTLFGCVSVAASAARDPWQTLADSLRQSDADPWDTMDAYWAAAKQVRSRENKAPRQIGEAVLRKLLDRGMSLAEITERNVIARLRQFEGTDGVFSMSKTRDEALLSLPSSVENIPGKLTLARRWDWNKFRRSDTEKYNTTELRSALKDWRSLFGKTPGEKLLLKIESVRAALQAQNVTAELLSHFGLPSIETVNELQNQAEAQIEIASYAPLAEIFAKQKNPKWLSDKRLREELNTARESAAALDLLSRAEPEIYAALDFAPQAAQEYIAIVTQALTTSDANALAAQIAKAIQGDGIYPAMAYAQQKYSFNAAGLSFDEILQLYETIVLADAALTGRIGSQANFPGYDVAARLRTAHGITVASAPVKAIAAVRAAFKSVDARLSADYSAVPVSSGWQSAAPGYNYDPAPQALQALNDAGGPLKSDGDQPSYERTPSAAAPAPVKIDPAAGNDSSNFITEPDWSVARTAPEPVVPARPAPALTASMIAEEADFVSGTVNGTDYTVYNDYLAAWAQYINSNKNYTLTTPMPSLPATNAVLSTFLTQIIADYAAALQNYRTKLEEHAKWQFTKAAYAWIDSYETNDYPAVPNTASPPMDNSSRENAEYDLAWNYGEKYDYLVNLQARFRLELVYTMTKDTALQEPENAYRWLQCRWHDYETVQNDQNFSDYAQAITTYFALLQRNSDGTYTAQNGAFVPPGVNELIINTSAALGRVEIITGYGAFFHAYRLSLQPGDFVRYSNSDLRAEFADTEAKLAQFVKYFPNETVPAAWTTYLDTLRQAIKSRVFEGMGSLSGSAETIAKSYNASTLLPKPGSNYSYNFSNLELWESIQGFFTLTSAEQTKLALAQEVYAYLKGTLYSYETLHWELNAGQNAKYGADWLPERGLQDPIVLKAGQDEFQVTYEHVEVLIDKLDTLLNSNYFSENAQIKGSVPAFRLPELDGAFAIRLGELRSSAQALVIEDPATGISVTLPPLPTQLDTTRIADQTSRVKAERTWIQAYRADVLLYLMHTVFESIQSDESLGAADFLGWLLAQVLPGDGGENVNQFTGAKVIEGVNKALAGVDLSAAVRPIFTELLTENVTKNLLTNQFPNTILSLYGAISEVLRPVFAGQLLIDPANPGGAGLIPDTRFAALSGLDLTLGYVLEQITGKPRYSITVSDLAENPAFADILGSGGVALPELFLGAELTPNDLVTKCWPEHWPKETAAIPAGAPAYVSQNAQNISNIYNFLNTPENFYGGKNDAITSWQGCNYAFDWGFDAIADPAQRRQAFEDVTTFSMSGIAFLLSCVFGNTPLNVHVEGVAAPYLNSGAPGPQKENDRWYTDLIIGLASVTDKINDIIQGAVGAFNAVIDTLNAPTKWLNETFGWNLPLIPQVDIAPLLLPDVRMSNYLGDASYDSDTSDADVHWRGRYDSRVGMESTLSAVNAYGKIVVPFYERLNFTPLYSEIEFNQAMAGLTGNVGALMQNDDKTALRNALCDISSTITKALTTPLLDWLAPLDDAKVKDSLGYSPVSKVLDLLPNLAYATERKLPDALLNDVLNGLTLNVTLHLGGLSGGALPTLQDALTEYAFNKMFDPNFYVALFGTILPDLVHFGPLLDKILNAASSSLMFIFAQPLELLSALQPEDYAALLLNRNDGNGGEDDFLTVLEGRASATPGSGVRAATLGTLIGFFAGDSAAGSLNFELFGAGGLPLGQKISEQLTAKLGACGEHETTHPKTITGWLHHQTGLAIGGSVTELLNGVLAKLFPVSDEEPDERTAQLKETVKTAAKNTPQLEGFLIELFNPQTYPATDFMRYALLDRAQQGGKFNEVQYSDKWNAKWTAKRANYLSDHLRPFLDSVTKYLIGRDFTPWMQEQLNKILGFDMQHPYNAQNLNAILDKIADLLGGWDFGDAMRDKADQIRDDNRADFTAVLCEALQPLAPTLKICLTGGRTEGDGSITKAGGNLTWLEDTLGFSGYDGYKQALIPIYEHLGVPQDELPDYDEFVARAADDNEFFAMLIDPLLNLFERIAKDPLGELLPLLPNMIYFFAAEEGEINNFSQCVNRLLRPVNAALDMVTPMLPAQEAFALLGISYPFYYDAAGKVHEFRLPAVDSANNILVDLLKNTFSQFSDKVGLNITLALSDLTDLVTGELSLYTSKNGQTDAVRLDSAQPEFLTNLLRKLIVLVFTDENYAEFRRFIEERLPDNRRKLSLALLDQCAKEMKKTLNKSDGADRVLLKLYSKFFVTEKRLNVRLWFRDLWSKIRVWWFSLLSNSKISWIRSFGLWRLGHLKDSIITLEGGFRPNGIVGFYQQIWGWFAEKMPWLTNWLAAVFWWLHPVWKSLVNS